MVFLLRDVGGLNGEERTGMKSSVYSKLSDTVTDALDTVTRPC
jgi:hypothetical protein